MPNLKKMMKHNDTTMPHAGNLIRKVMEQKSMNITTFARRMNAHRSALTRSLSQPTVQAALLWKAGQVLQYDFFAVLSTASPYSSAITHSPTARELELQQQVVDLQKENEMCKKMLELAVRR